MTTTLRPLPAGSRSMSLTPAARCVRGRSGTARTWRGRVRGWTARRTVEVVSPALTVRCIEIGVA